MGTMLDQEGLQAVSVLLRATTEVVGERAPVVTNLRRLIQDRSEPSYQAAERSFDALAPGLRLRIAQKAPLAARRKLQTANLPGILGALTRR